MWNCVIEHNYWKRWNASHLYAVDIRNGEHFPAVKNVDSPNHSNVDILCLVSAQQQGNVKEEIEQLYSRPQLGQNKKKASGTMY